METSVFFDEFRPFRRGEIALARRFLLEPDFLPEGEIDLLRHAVRLAQLSALPGGAPDALVHPLGSFRLRALQFLAPVLPTDPARIDAPALHAMIPKIAHLVAEAREDVVRLGLASEETLDADLARKRLALVLGGAAGSGYVFIGALRRLEAMDVVPDYMAGCSIGTLLAILRGRRRRLELAEILREIEEVRVRGVFRPPVVSRRFGLPGALRLDLRRALGKLFQRPDGSRGQLRDLEIPVDALATGLGPGALARPPEEYAKLVDVDLGSASGLAELRGTALARAVSALVSLAMSRRVLSPVFLGADPRTAQLPALDAAGFSCAIPVLLHYDAPPEDAHSASILEEIFQERGLVALVDGVLSSMVPARFAWEAIEAGRIGSRHCLIVALDAIMAKRGPLASIQHVFHATAHRDRGFWDVHVPFRRVPPVLQLFPTAARLARAADDGELEFEPYAALIRTLLSPLPPWRSLAPRL